MDAHNIYGGNINLDPMHGIVNIRPTYRGTHILCNVSIHDDDYTFWLQDSREQKKEILNQ